MGSILPHTMDIKKGLLFTEGGVSLQLHRRDAALSGRVFTVGHCSIPPCSEAVLHCTTRTVGGRLLPSSGLLEGFMVFAENTGLVVGRTLVDPSGWRVPVLVSNFGQETVMVEPFSEIGMIAQVSAIQPVMDQPSRTSCDPSMLPDHLQRLLDLTSQDLDNVQRGQLASTLLQFADLFPMPGSALTGHTDAVEHTIDTGTSAPIRCAPRRMSPQKIKKEEACVTEMLTSGQIEPSDSPWSAPGVLVTKKDGGTLVEFGDGKGCLPLTLTSDRRYPGQWGIQRMPTSFPYSLERIGWLNSMTTYLDRPLERFFVLLLYSSRTPHASHY